MLKRFQNTDIREIWIRLIKPNDMLILLWTRDSNDDGGMVSGTHNS